MAGMRGRLLLDRRPHGFQDGLRTGKDVVIPESEDPETLRPEPAITLPIPCSIPLMLTAIHLDDEAAFETGEVRDTG